MTAVFIADVREIDEVADFLKRRREEGLDLLDEVWEGVLHMSPPPHAGHQRLAAALVCTFRIQAERHGLGEVLTQVGVRKPGSGKKNFRVPDLAVVPPDRVDQIAKGWLEDGLSLVVEVRSPREALAEKLPFYAARHVGEVLWIDWRTLETALFRLFGDGYIEVAVDRDGFLEVRALGLRIRRVKKKRKPSLEIEDALGGGPLPQA